DAADIKVEFTLNIQHLAEQLQISLYIVIAISAILVIIPIILMQSIFYQLNKNISTTVSDIIDIYINQNQVDENLDTALDSSRLKTLGKDLVPSFNRLSHFLKTKSEDIQSA
ncbi:diguanylate phosphodiesterase, partial [Pseudoalteromonas ruthenica]